MPLQTGPQPYRSNVLHGITTRLQGFVPSAEATVGSVLLKELLQNADDAGATEMLVVLDQRRPSDELLSAGGDLVLPGLLVVNNGPFGDEHFDAITEVASGQKLNDSAATGRFGVGFTSVYLAGDSCLLLSDNTAVLFDLLRRVMPLMGSLDGTNQQFGERDAIWPVDMTAQSRREWNPAFEQVLRHACCSDVSAFPTEAGSVIHAGLRRQDFQRISAFRIPLRGDQGNALYSARYPDAASQGALLEQMIAETGSSLAFLRKIESIRFARVGLDSRFEMTHKFNITPWPQNGAQFFANVRGNQGEHVLPRTKRTITQDGEMVSELQVTMHVVNRATQATAGNGGTGDRFDQLRGDNSSWKKAVAVAGVAVATRGDTRKGEPWRVALPLIDPGPCGAFLHGGFFLDEARRAPTFVVGGEGETRWNKEIISRLLLPQLIRMLREISTATNQGEESSIRLLHAMPEFSASDPESAVSISKYLSAKFYGEDWAIRISDVGGRPFEFSKDVVLPPAAATGMIIQEIDDVLAPYSGSLPAVEKLRPVRYVSAGLFAAIRSRFPSANWCRRAEAIDGKAVLSILKNPIAPHTQPEIFDRLVRRLSGGEELTNEALTGARLMWSESSPVEFHPDKFYVLKSDTAHGAFHEAIERLGLGIEGLVRVEPGIGAADPNLARTLGLTNIFEPSDETLLQLLSHVEESENRHDRFEADELADGAGALQELLTQIAQESPNRLEAMRLAWTICSEGGSEIDALNQVVVVHCGVWADAASQVLWDSFLSEVCPRVDHRLMEFHAGIQSRLNSPIECFDSEDASLVRTKPHEILSWLGKLFWQRGSLQRQQHVIDALGEVIQILENRGADLGADAIIRACARFRFFFHEFDLLCCLPIHRVVGGERIALGAPDPGLGIHGRKSSVRNGYRLQPRDTVPPPPDAVQAFRLLAPPNEVRGFYEVELGIQVHTTNLEVLDLLRRMTGGVRVSPAAHLERLKYLAAYVPQAELGGDAAFQVELAQARGSALLLPCVDGFRTSGDAVDASQADSVLLDRGWDEPERSRVIALLALPKGVADIDVLELSCLQMLNARPQPMREVDLPVIALSSEYTELELRDRLRLLAEFHGLLPIAGIRAAKCVAGKPVPLLNGAETNLGSAEHLPRGCYGLSDGIVAQFFPNAIDVARLAKQAGVPEESLRDHILGLLGSGELPHASAAKRIRDELGEHWSELKMEERLELFHCAESWRLNTSHLFEVAFPSLNGEQAAGVALQLYGCLVQRAHSEALAELDPDQLQSQIVYPCRDGKFHFADRCWFSTDLSIEVQIESGAEFVVEATSDAEKLRNWFIPDASKRYDLEELYPPRIVGTCTDVGGIEPMALHGWKEVLRLVANPASKLGAELRNRYPTGAFVWGVRVVEDVKVSHDLSDHASVSPSDDWAGPPAAIDLGTATLCVRHVGVPEMSQSKELRSFDLRVAREVLFGLGAARDDRDFLQLRDLLTGELDRPGDVLERLRRRRKDGLIERYDYLNADREFLPLINEREGLVRDTAEWTRKTDELIAGVMRRMLEALRREMEELGYSRNSFYAEMAQNAEDACIQRDVLGMGEPESSTLTIRRVGAELWIEHFGRPFNYWRHAEKSEPTFREDIARITSDRGSFKQQNDGPEVTGKFGVGFKCVYWLTDRPRVHSHIWHFEIESTCIPKRIEAPPDHSALATRFILPLRNERRGDALLSPPEAASLLLFTRKLTAVKICTNGNESILGRRAEELEGTNGSVVSFDIDGHPLVQALRISDAGHHLALDLDWGTRLPKRRDPEVPDTYHTFPLTGDRHRLGVAISAPFALQSGRAHLAGAGSEHNLRTMEQLGDLISGSGGALIAASSRPGVADKLSWFGAFWRIWDFSGKPDTALRSLASRLARGLAQLGQHSDVVPRLDGSLRSLEAAPAAAFTDEIPQKFGLVLSQRAVHRDRVWPELPIGTQNLVTAELATTLRTISRETGIPGLVTSLGWEQLKRLLQGAGSLFISDPDLLALLAEGLIEGGSESNRLAAVAALRECHLSDDRGEPGTPSEMWNLDWLGERELPRFAFRFFRFPSDEYSGGGVNLLRGAGLQNTVSWESFKALMDHCPDADSAKHLLLFLDRAKLWRNWNAHREALLAAKWVPTPIGQPASIDDADLDGRWFSNDFREWLFSKDAPMPSLPLVFRQPPSAVISAIREWWEEVGEQEARHYESRLYPEDFVQPEFGSMSDLNRREAWLRFFILALSHTLGRSKEEQHRNFLTLAESKGWLSVFADPDATSDDWIGILDSYFEENEVGIPYYHWLRLFAPIRCLSLYLPTYVAAFEDIHTRLQHDHAPERFLNSATSIEYQGTTRLAPPATQILGIGACFALRELNRLGVMDNPNAHRHCFTPKGSVRRAFERISGQEPERLFQGSQSMASWLTFYNGGVLETFGNSFDLPLMILWERYPNVLDEILESED